MLTVGLQNCTSICVLHECVHSMEKALLQAEGVYLAPVVACPGTAGNTVVDTAALWIEHIAADSCDTAVSVAVAGVTGGAAAAAEA